MMDNGWSDRYGQGNLLREVRSMKVRAATVPAVGVAALAASVMLAGCGSGSKTASSSSAPAESKASSTSAAASSAAAASTKAGPPGAPSVSLPNLPGWVGDPETLNGSEGKASPTMESHYVAALKTSQGDGILAFVMTPKSSSDTLNLDTWLQASLPPDAKPDKDCEFVTPPAKTTVSGFNAVAENERCTGAGGSHDLDTRYIAVPGTNGGPNYAVTIVAGGPNLADTMKLVDEQTKITAGQ